MIRASLFLLLLSVSLNTLANEVDDFTHRKEILALSAEQQRSNLYAANDRVNKSIHTAVKEFNSNKSCIEGMKHKPPVIYYRMKRILSGGMRGGDTGEWAARSRTIVKSRADQYLYGDSWGLEPSFNLNGHVVGTDKLSQFGNYGFQVFEAAFLNQEATFEKGLAYNNELEDYVYGINASGIKSYADMAANYSGMQFYMNLLHGENKYLSCNQSTGKYKVERDFNWADYVNDSWDEGINCSKFYKTNYPYNKQINEAQEKNLIHEQSFLASFSDKDYISLAGSNFIKNSQSEQFSCPDNIKQCQAIAKLQCATHLVSPRCLASVDLINQNCSSLNLGEFNVPKSQSSYRYTAD